MDLVMPDEPRAEASVVAHRQERARRRPKSERIVCDSCGAELAEVRAGGSAWCSGCGCWSGGPAKSGMVGDA